MVAANKTRTHPSATSQQQTERAVWLTHLQAAEHINMNPRTLQDWRYRHYDGQPPYSKFPGRNGSVRYKLQDLDAWLESRGNESN